MRKAKPKAEAQPADGRRFSHFLFGRVQAIKPYNDMETIVRLDKPNADGETEVIVCNEYLRPL